MCLGFNQYNSSGRLSSLYLIGEKGKTFGLKRASLIEIMRSCNIASVVADRPICGQYVCC